MIPRFTLRPISNGFRFFTTQARDVGERWNLVSAVCLQRKPVVSKPLTEIERQAKELLLQLEQENSLKSNHELNSEEEKRAIEQEGKIVLKTYADKEVEWKSEFDNMKLGPCDTEADRLMDVKSLDRLLSSTLILVVKQENHGNRWILPQGYQLPREPMHVCAQRVLRQLCGRRLRAKFYGKVPCGYFQYKYPKDVRGKEGIVGDKVFFFKAKFVAGSLSTSNSIKDFQWIGRNELKKALDSRYCHAVEQFLIDEDN